MSYFGGYNRLQETGFASMDNNTVAITMVTCIGLAFFLGLYSPRLWQQGLAFVAALFMTHAVMISFSRGGLLSLIVTGAVSFVLIPKGPKHYAAFVVAALIGLRLAGPAVVERFATTFLDKTERDGSAMSRLMHWEACIDSLMRNPLGVGPNHWRFVAPTYGLPKMEAHSFWLQTGAELGVPGLSGYVVFYGGTMLLLWPLSRRRGPAGDPGLTCYAQMVISSLVGFCLSAQFVTVQGVEVPFYVTLVGLGTLKLHALSLRDRASPSFDPANFRLATTA
jgi:O-antigen ligase